MVDGIVQGILRALGRKDEEDEGLDEMYDDDAPWSWRDTAADRDVQVNWSVAGMIANALAREVAKQTGQPPPGFSPAADVDAQVQAAIEAHAELGEFGGSPDFGGPDGFGGSGFDGGF